jgi:hypothetical protein
MTVLEAVRLAAERRARFRDPLDYSMSGLRLEGTSVGGYFRTREWKKRVEYYPFA